MRTVLLCKVNQLGDNIVFLPVAQALRQALPAADRLVVFTSPVVRELYANCVPGAEVHTFGTSDFNAAWKQPLRLLRIVRSFRACAPDAILLGDDQGNVAHLGAALSGAKIMVTADHQRVPACRLIRDRVTLTPTDLIAQQNWQLLRRLAEQLGVTVPVLPPPPDLSALTQGSSTDYDVIIHAGASRDYKRWPLQHYVTLANTLAQTQRVAWIDCGQDATGLAPTVVQVDTPTLRALVRQLAAARLFVGNNSGPMNLAIALGLHGVILNGPSAANWDPAWYAQRWQLLRDPALPCQPCDALTHPLNHCTNSQQPMACMLRWSVAAVAQRILAQLA